MARQATTSGSTELPEFMQSAGYGEMIRHVITRGVAAIQHDAEQSGDTGLASVAVSMGNRAARELGTYHEAPTGEQS